MRRPLRPLLNEWCEAEWQLFRAHLYGLFTFKCIWVMYNKDDRIDSITCGDKVFYVRGKT